MKQTTSRINYIMERIMNEDDGVSGKDEDKKVIKIFYGDLDMSGKQKVLEGIDASFEYIDVFTDEVVRDNIEEALSKRPLIMIDGQDLVNKMGIDL